MFIKFCFTNSISFGRVSEPMVHNVQVVADQWSLMKLLELERYYFKPNIYVKLFKFKFHRDS